jgi:capsular polysaccharide biosynthesis protein
VLQGLTAQKFRFDVRSAESVKYPVIANVANRGLALLLCAWCVVAVLRHAQALPATHRRALVILLAPWIYLAFRDLYLGVHPNTHSMLYPLVILAAWALRPPLEKLAVLGYLTGATAIISILMGVLQPDTGIFRAVTGSVITPEKQILPWGILVGPLTSGNNLGQVLVLGLPAIAFIRSAWVRAGLGAVTTAAVVWSASRSSLAAIVLGMVVALVLSALTPALRRAAAVTGLTGMAAFVVILPLITHSDKEFSNRSGIWHASLQAWSENPIFGQGSRFYRTVAGYAGPLGGTAFHGHNQFVHTLTVGGLVYLFLAGVLVALLIGAAARWAQIGVRYPAVFLAMFFVSCTLEVSFGFVDRDFLLASTVIPVAFIAFGRPGAPGVNEQESLDTMAANEYAALLRTRWRMVATIAALFVAVAAVWSVSITPTYRARTNLFLTPMFGERPKDLAAAVPLAQTQIRTYVELADMPIVLEPVIRDLDLHTSPERLARSVTAQSPFGTVVIEVSVTDASPTKAAAIANAVARQLARTVRQLTPKTTAGKPVVQVVSAGEADAPTVPYTPRKRLNVYVALLVGLFVGAATALQLDAIEARGAATRRRAPVDEEPVPVGESAAAGAG